MLGLPPLKSPLASVTLNPGYCTLQPVWVGYSTLSPQAREWLPPGLLKKWAFSCLSLPKLRILWVCPASVAVALTSLLWCGHYQGKPTSLATNQKGTCYGTRATDISLEVVFGETFCTSRMVSLNLEFLHKNLGPGT